MELHGGSNEISMELHLDLHESSVEVSMELHGVSMESSRTSMEAPTEPPRSLHGASMGTSTETSTESPWSSVEAPDGYNAFGYGIQYNNTNYRGLFYSGKFSKVIGLIGLKCLRNQYL